MKKKYTDAQSYFQDWAQVKRKEVQDMEKSMRENPLYQKEVNPMDDDETWSERFHFTTSYFARDSLKKNGKHIKRA